MPVVNIPNVGSVTFPDTMSPEDITKAIERDILKTAKPAETTSAVSAFGKSALENVVPATTGLAGGIAGAQAGAGLGSMFGPVGAVVGGLGGAVAGGLGGGALGEKAQNLVTQFIPESVRQATGFTQEQRQREIEENPNASFAGALAPNLAFFRPGAVAPIVTKTGKIITPTMQRGAMAAAGGGLEAGQELVSEGTVDPAKVAMAAAFQGVAATPTRLGQKFINRLTAAEIPKEKLADPDVADFAKQREFTKQGELELENTTRDVTLPKENAPNQFGVRQEELVLDENGIPIRRQASAEAASPTTTDLFSQENMRRAEADRWQEPSIPNREYLKQQEIEQAYVQREQQARAEAAGEPIAEPTQFGQGQQPELQGQLEMPLPEQKIETMPVAEARVGKINPAEKVTSELPPRERVSKIERAAVRESQKAYIEYENKIKDAFPDATPDEIRTAFDNRQAQQQEAKAATLSDVAPQQQKALEKLPGFVDNINQGFIPVENIDAEIARLPGSADVKESALVSKFASGGVVQSVLANNPVVRVGSQVINGLKKRSDRLLAEILTSKTDGILTKRQQIEITMGVDKFNNEFADWTRSTIDPDFKPTHSPMFKEWLDLYLKHRSDQLKRWNSVREIIGLKPIKELPNYFSLIREGPFGFVVKDGAGNSISFVRERTLEKAQAAHEFYKQKIQADGLDWTVGDAEHHAAMKRSPFTRTARGEQLSMADLVTLLGEDNPNVTKASDMYRQLLLEEAQKTSGAYQREMKRVGFEGAKGTKEWKSPAENAKEGFEAIESSFRQVENQISALETSNYINKIVDNPDIQAPNAKAMVQAYYDHAYNRVDRVIEATSGLNNWFERTTGKDVGYVIDGIRVSKNALMSMTLGFGNVRFLATQLVQPWQVLPPMMEYLKSTGAKGNSLPSMFMGVKDGLAYLAQQYSKEGKFGPTDDLTKAIWTYMEKQHITASHLLEQPHEYGSQITRKGTELVKRLATGEMSKFESATRAMAFSSLTRFLVDSGVPLNKALQMAEGMTEFTMVSYETHNKPQIYSHMGIVGELASSLKTYQHNIISQQAFYTKEALRGNPRALGMQLGNTLMFAGALGFFGMAELDKLMDWINSTFGTTMTTPSEFLVNNAPRFISVGGVSAATGLDFHSSLASQGVVPKSPGEALFPLLGKASNIFEMGGRFVSNPTKENLAAFAREPISALAGYAELGLSKEIEPDKFAVRNARTRETEAIRTRGEAVTRAVTGFRPIEETIQTKKGLFAKKDEKLRADKRTSLLQDIKENVVDLQTATEKGQTFQANAARTRQEKLINEYLKNGGTMESIKQQLQGHLESRGMTTPLMRKEMEAAKGKPTVEKILRMQKLQELTQ